KLAAAVETAGSQVNRPDDRPQAIGEQHLAVKLEIFHFTDLDPDIVHDTQTAYALDQFFLFECVRRSGHDVNFHSTHMSADQMLDDNGVLIALVLQEQSMFRAIDKCGDA